MPHERFFLEKELQEKETLIVRGPELHHIKDVMRLRNSDCLEIINGKGTLGVGIIKSLSKDKAEIFLSHCEVYAEKKPYLILAQALPRFQKLEFILEKGTELGATDFWLFPGKGSEKETLSTNQLRRINLILQGALKQCGRVWLPKVELKAPLLEWTSIPGSLFFGDLEGKSLPAQLEEKEAIVLFIGPEKGWHKEEKEYLLSTLKAKPVLLSPYTLRAETAAIAGLTLLSNLYLKP